MWRAALSVCLLLPVGHEARAQEALTGPAPAVSSTEEQPPRWVRGTDVELMVVREVNSRSARAGDRFRLRVNSPVMLDGVTVIPVGATAWGEIVTVTGTSAAGGRGQLSLRLLHVDTRWGPVAMNGTKGTEGDANTGGVIFGILGFGIFGLLNKGGNATFKAGDIINGYIAEGDTPPGLPLQIAKGFSGFTKPDMTDKTGHAVETQVTPPSSQTAPRLPNPPFCDKQFTSLQSDPDSLWSCPIR